MRKTFFSLSFLLATATAAPLVAQPPEGGERPEGPPRRFDPAAFFERHDEDGDGAISEEEAPGRMAEHFGDIDADGDGKITLEEFEASRPPRGEGEGRPPRGEGGEGDGPPPRDGEGRPPRGEGEGGEGRPPRGEGRPPRGEGGEGRPQRDPGQFAERVFERLDENEDGLLTLDEVPEQFQAGFQEILDSVDAEGVTLEQYKAAMEERFAERRAQREAGEGQGDRPRRSPGEGDAERPRRDRPERDRPQGDRPGPNPERMMGHMLERMDTNEDGEVSREEFLAHVGERFDGVDANGDGVVDAEELGAAMEAIRPPHRPGGPRPEGPPPAEDE